MIQSQFDAATRLGGPSSQQSLGESDEHAVERHPRKRRKTSPHIEDSIEVAANGSSVDANCPDASHEDVSVGLEQDDAGSQGASGVDNADKNSGTSPTAIVIAETQDILAVTESQHENGTTQKPDDPEKSISAEESVFADNPAASEHMKNTSAVADVSDFSNSVLSSDSLDQGAPQSALTAPKAIETPTPSEAQPGPSVVTSIAAPAAQVCSARSLEAHALNVFQTPRLRHASQNTQHIPSQTSAPSTGLSTPKHVSHHYPQIKNSSPLSSPPTELFDPFDEQSTHPTSSSSRPSSPVSEGAASTGNGNGKGEGDDESDQSLSQEQFNRSSTLRRSLSTLKGRELFDAAIWADPLKTSVFYTFATNLRQKSRDASPTGCHHFISHLSKAGKMVRCYTQNIDLLEDKVGLSTRLLLGPGSRSRFSTRTSAKNAAGPANARNPGDNNNQPAVVPIVSDPVPSGDACERAVDERARPEGCCPSASQGASSSLVEEVVDQQRSSTGELGVAGENGNNEKPADAQDQVNSVQRERDLEVPDGPPADAKTSSVDKPASKPDSGPSSPERDRGVECVFLHGSLRSLRCFQCGCVANWDECNRELQTMSGSQPPCPRCEDATAARQERGKRALGVGKLRPDVVLYGEEHPDSQQISTIIQHDISLAPDMLIVMGTSLKVHGLKTVVREFAKTVHNRKDGKVIFVNYTKPAESVWADIFDFWVEMDCDSWIEDLKEKKPIIWLPPGSVEEEPRSTKRRRQPKDEAEKKESKKSKKADGSKDVKVDVDIAVSAPPSDKPAPTKTKKLEKDTALEASKAIPKRPAAFRDCKQNAAYWTTKIWAHLAITSGRSVTAPAAPAPLKITSSVADAPTPVPHRSSAAQGPAKLTEPLRIRRGPRTKNAKSKKAMLKAAETSDLVDEQSSTSCKPPRTAKEQRRRQPKSIRSEAPITPASAAANLQLDSLDTKVEAANSPVASAGIVLSEVPIPNTMASPNGVDNSILAAVKSNPRIRKPKAIFGESPPPADLSSRTSSSTLVNSKVKARTTSQSKKPKSTVKVEDDEKSRHAEPSHVGADIGQHHLNVLPKPSPRVDRPQMVINTSQTLQSHDESFTLPPIQAVQPTVQATNHGRRDSLLQLALGPSPATASNTRTPPAYLEPIVSPAPEDITPIMSPHHWRNRAFTFGDPLAKHFEAPHRSLDYASVPQNSRGETSPGAFYRFNGPYQDSRWAEFGQPPRPVESSQRVAGTGLKTNDSPSATKSPGLEDSPSRQLQRESDAATALSQMSQRAIYDSRFFARM